MTRVGAIVRLRLRLLLRRARGAGGVFDTLSALLFLAVGSVFSLGMAAGCGLLVAANTDDPLGTDFVYLVPFWMFLFFGLVLPVVRGAIEQGFDARPFLVYPLGRVRLYLVTLAAAFGGAEHVFYYPALAAMTGAMLFVTRLAPAPTLLTMLLLAVNLVVWGNTVQLALSALMRTRRAREIAAIVAFVLVLAASIGPSALIDRDAPPGERTGSWVGTTARAAATIGATFPPSLAAGALDAIAAGRTRSAGWPIAGLAGWAAAGTLLGFRAFRAYLVPRTRGARASSRRGGTPTRRWLTVDHAWLAGLPVETRAVAAKELRYLLRSVVGRFILVMVPLFGVLVGGIFRDVLDHEVLGLRPDTLLLFGLLLYSVMFSNNFVNNAFAWEGPGIQAYFVSPAPSVRVILGKNLGVWAFNAIVLALLVPTWTLLTGFPGWPAFVSALLLFWILLLVVTASGNVLSVLFPVARSVSSMMNSPSQTAVLLSFVSLSFGIGLITTSLTVAWIAGLELYLPLLLAWVLAGVVGLYYWGLRISAKLLDERRDRVIEALRRVR